jgi:FixJ family two-component response regulator
MNLDSESTQSLTSVMATPEERFNSAEIYNPPIRKLRRSTFAIVVRGKNIAADLGGSQRTVEIHRGSISRLHSS